MTQSKLPFFPFLMFLLLTGCCDDPSLTGAVADSDSNEDSPPSLSSFNLTSINAGTSGPKQLQFTWTAASNEAGITYSVCQKDTNEDNNCQALGASVTDVLTTTIEIESVAEALGKDYFMLASNGTNVMSSSESAPDPSVITGMIGYFKASNTETLDRFGESVAISDDGTLLAVSAYREDNGASGIFSDNSETTDTGTANDSGAVYIFQKTNGVWSQTAYIKASNTGADDNFGGKIALSGDGLTLAVGAKYEDNSAQGIITNGSETSDVGTASNAGAVYLFTRNGNVWTQTAYVKGSNTGDDDQFGHSLAVNTDGTVLAVGAVREDNGVTGVITNGSEVTDSGTASNSGAVYLFEKSGTTWSQVAYVKASNTGAGDGFGDSVALSGDGSTLAVGAMDEDNDATGVITDNSETTDTGTAFSSGAVYLFKNTSGWSQIAYVKASNTGSIDDFGTSVALNEDGTVLAVGAAFEDNGATGVILDGSETTDTGTAVDSGAAYLFENNGGSWSQTAYLKASNTNEADYFGHSVDVSSDGLTVVVGAYSEDSEATGITTDGSETTYSATATYSGAVYMYKKSGGVWSQSAYFKASNTSESDDFGSSLALNSDASTLVVGASGEENGATGLIFDGSETTDSGFEDKSGAVYLY
ncbi:hypothetical protein [Enterovibrio sp. 27052020O]|uniref:hypothetical protein n=1 Tax=Enterovibrio sp. 27052020O TaxID=3241166 RepID=UPI003890D5BA